MSQSQIFSSPVASSPLAISGADREASGNWAPADAILSGNELRYFPGVVSRSQRKNSTRQSSMHETDENHPGSKKKDASKD